MPAHAHTHHDDHDGSGGSEFSSFDSAGKAALEARMRSIERGSGEPMRGAPDAEVSTGSVAQPVSADEAETMKQALRMSRPGEKFHTDFVSKMNDGRVMSPDKQQILVMHGDTVTTTKKQSEERNFRRLGSMQSIRALISDAYATCRREITRFEDQATAGINVSQAIRGKAHWAEVVEPALRALHAELDSNFATISGLNMLRDERLRKWKKYITQVELIFFYWHWTSTRVRHGLASEAIVWVHFDIELSKLSESCNIAHYKVPKSLDDPYAARQLSMLAAMSPDAQVASTYTELRTAAQKCDLSNNQRRSIMQVLQGRSAAAPPRAPTAPRAPRDAARPARAPAASTSTRKGTPKTPRTCYNCGKEGHISKDCPEPPTASTLAARAKKAAGSQ